MLEGQRADGAAIVEGERRLARRLHRIRLEIVAPLTNAERAGVVSALFPNEGGRLHAWLRFSVMMSLSVVIAVMGLSENSTAVVIGAMLVAPLMTPVLALSASIVLAGLRRFGHAVLALFVGSAGSVGLSYALTLVLPVSDRALTAELLARTSPDLRDLVVGLAAGAAGAFATVRADVSASLPGVAVAVALVPPLATVGYTLAIGRDDLARGAVLLYITNLAAIILAGGLVFLAAGLSPVARHRFHRPATAIGIFAAVTAVVFIAFPLSIGSLNRATKTQVTQEANQAAIAWLSNYPSLRVDAVDVVGNRVEVDVVGPTRPPDTTALTRSLRGVLGPGAAVHVRWFSDASQTVATTTTTTTTTIAPTSSTQPAGSPLSTLPPASVPASTPPSSSPLTTTPG